MYAKFIKAHFLLPLKNLLLIVIIKTVILIAYIVHYNDVILNSAWYKAISEPSLQKVWPLYLHDSTGRSL